MRSVDHGPGEPGEAGERDDATSVASRVLSVIEAVAAGRGASSVAALARSLGLPKPTLHRICVQLESAGYLQRSVATRHFVVGPRLWALGFEVVNAGAFAERRAVVEALVGIVGETCNLAMRVGGKSLYIDRVESKWPLRMSLDPGARVPLHCTASGKLFLSDMTAAERARLLTETGLPVRTPNTIATLARMEEEIAAIRARDYSVDDEEFIEGLVALAVPIRNESGAIVAGLACHGPKPRFTLERAMTFLPDLRRAAAKLKSLLIDADAGR